MVLFFFLKKKSKSFLLRELESIPFHLSSFSPSPCFAAPPTHNEEWQKFRREVGEASDHQNAFANANMWAQMPAENALYGGRMNSHRKHEASAVIQARHEKRESNKHQCQHRWSRNLGQTADSRDVEVSRVGK